MANHFKTTDPCDDGALRVIRYRELLADDHPVRYIERFISGLDVSSFESRYKVGIGQKGRAPQDIRTMLGVILYGLYCRKYSARKIDYATEHHSDFWFFTNGKRISHDKITEFINLHGKDVLKVFYGTIQLAQQNGLLSFEGLYVDGFFLKASAAKRHSYNQLRLEKKAKRLAVALDEVLERMGKEDVLEDPALDVARDKIKKDMAKIDSLRQALDRKIKQRTEGKAPYKVKEIAEKLTINTVDPDSDLMKQKDDSMANAYLEVCATDAKADIIVASAVAGHNDEPHMMLDLFEQAKKNCEGKGEYTTVLADSNFTTIENCHAFEGKNIALVGPTRADDYQGKRAAEGTKAMTFSYDAEGQCVKCSCGATFIEEERSFDKYKKTTIVAYSDRKACQKCERLGQCTGNKKGYRQIRIDIRRPALQRVQQRYESEKGKALYKKRSHVAETYQGDKRKNGSFIQLMRRGLEKARVDALWQDVVWNLRRVFNAMEGRIAWGG